MVADAPQSKLAASLRRRALARALGVSYGHRPQE
jgi:hypothetical protein